MLRRTPASFGGMHTGSFSPGTRGQKNSMMMSMPFIYRMAGRKGPGVYMMKYWWTLGMFPSGMEAPFRLQEFRSMYMQQHVPVEVEEWLLHYIKNPADDIVPNAEKFVELLEAVRDVKPTPFNRIHVTNVKPLKAALDGFLVPNGVSASASSLRAVAEDNMLKENILDCVYAYRSVVEAHGSTPHRRLALSALQEKGEEEGSGLQLDGMNAAARNLRIGAAADSSLEGGEGLGSRSPQEYGLSTEAAKQIGWALDIDSTSTAPDETLLINTLSILAQGSAKINKHEDAALTLTSALGFAHDDRTRGQVHCNVASARCTAGDFKEAEWHAKESVVLTDSARSYATWAVTVANQDRVNEAKDILDEALQLHEKDDTLSGLMDQVEALAATRPTVPIDAGNGMNLQGVRVRTQGQLARGLAQAPGLTLNHEFDTVQFKGKVLPHKMDVRNNSMGSIFRRVAVPGSFVGTTSTQQSEPL